MAINLEEIKKAFEDNRTPEQKLYEAEIAAAWSAYDTEQNAWNDECYDNNISGDVFRSGREAIRQKYLSAGIIRPAQVP